MVGFEKALRAAEVIKDQIQYRSQSLLNLARGYFSSIQKFDNDYDIISMCYKCNITKIVKE